MHYSGSCLGTSPHAVLHAPIQLKTRPCRSRHKASGGRVGWCSRRQNRERRELMERREGGSRSGGEFCLLVFYRPLSLRSWHAVPLSFRSKGGGTGWLVGSSSRRPCAFRARWGDGAGQCGHPPAPALSGHHPLRRGAPASLPLGADTATSRAVAPSHIHNL